MEHAVAGSVSNMPGPPAASARHRRVRRLGRFLVVACVAYALDLLVDSQLQYGSPTDGPWLTKTLFGAAGVYHRLVTWGPRQPAPKFTALLEIRPERGNQVRNQAVINPCASREFLGHLFTKLSRYHPSAVVLDASFNPDSCLDAKANDKLIAGLQSLCDDDVAVVVGVQAEIQADERLRGTTPLLKPSYPFIKALKNCRAEEALLNIDVDHRRVLLQSRVQRDPSVPADLPTFAYSAVRILGGEQALGKRVRSALGNLNEPPYVSFLHPAEFQTGVIDAWTFLCGQRQGGPDFKFETCVEDPAATDVARRVRGQIVVVGYIDEDDRIDTVAGKQPGYLLQANYIESLRDDRIFRAVPGWLNACSGLLIFVLFEAIMYFNQGMLPKALAWLAGLLAVSVLVVFTLVVHLGVYLNPVTFSLLAVVTRLGGEVVEWMYGSEGRA